MKGKSAEEAAINNDNNSSNAQAGQVVVFEFLWISMLAMVVSVFVKSSAEGRKDTFLQSSRQSMPKASDSKDDLTTNGAKANGLNLVQGGVVDNEACKKKMSAAPTRVTSINGTSSASTSGNTFQNLSSRDSKDPCTECFSKNSDSTHHPFCSSFLQEGAGAKGSSADDWNYDQWIERNLNPLISPRDAPVAIGSKTAVLQASLEQTKHVGDVHGIRTGIPNVAQGDGELNRDRVAGSVQDHFCSQYMKGGFEVSETSGSDDWNYDPWVEKNCNPCNADRPAWQSRC